MIAPYAPGTRPAIAGGDMTFVVSELTRVAAVLRDLRSLAPQACTSEPDRRVDGMQRLARSPWHPAAGQSVDAWVYFDEASLTWKLL